MPMLWSSISVWKPTEPRLLLSTLWLSRSDTCPLTLGLRQSFEPDEQEHAFTDRILSLFTVHVKRWSRINFKLSGPPSQILLGIQHGSVSSLESAALDLHSWDDANFGQLWRSIHTSPSLRRVHWGTPYLDSLPNHAPWSQLTHITTLCQLSADEALTMLSLCPEIVSIDLQCLWSPSSIHRSTSVVLLRAEVLTIRAHTNPDPFFNGITLPVLRSLDIAYQLDSDDQISLCAMVDLLHRSQCRLDIFSIKGREFVDEELLGCLATYSLSSIVELTLVVNASDELIASLIRRPSPTSSMLPRLQVLRLPRCLAPGGLIVEMVQSRVRGDEASLLSSCLRALEVRVDHFSVLERATLVRLANAYGLRYCFWGL